MRKWRFLTQHHTGHPTPWHTLGRHFASLGAHLTDCWRTLGTHFDVSSSPYHVVRDGNSADFGEQFCQLGRGGWLSQPSCCPPPPTFWNSGFCLFLLTKMTSARYSCCYFFLLIQPFFLMLMQPSQDGYFQLFISKSSKVAVCTSNLLLYAQCALAKCYHMPSICQQSATAYASKADQMQILPF